jgi:hypothetical protein
MPEAADWIAVFIQNQDVDVRLQGELDGVGRDVCAGENQDRRDLVR